VTQESSYLWHVKRAADFDLLADRHHRRGFFLDAQQARAKAERHRNEAAIIDLEKRANAA
jgi:hypothetical protein